MPASVTLRDYFLFPILVMGLLVVACETSAEVSREIRDIEPQMTVSANDLLGDYEANEVAADLKYKDKVVLVTGVIDRFVSGEEPKVYFDTGSGITEVTCGFSSQEVVSVAELKKGQQVTFRGKVTGKGLFDVQVKGCNVWESGVQVAEAGRATTTPVALKEVIQEVTETPTPKSPAYTITPSETTTKRTSPAITAGKSAPKPTPSGPRTEFGDGTWSVGLDILPGLYRIEGGDNCSWTRLSGFGGGISDVIAIEIPVGPSVVAVEPTDAGFQSKGCGTWVLQS